MRQIKLLTDERNAESLADMLMDAGALSATIEDADAESVDENHSMGNRDLNPRIVHGRAPFSLCSPKTTLISRRT